MVDYSVRQIATNRAALYHWFALAFFAPPTETEVADLQSGRAQGLLLSLAATPGAEQGIEAMRRVLASGPALSVASVLGAAHARFFYGVGGYEAVLPYRSIYTSEHGLLCQQATAEMERVLRQHRLRLENTVCEPADHLSIQLEVMSQLATRFAEAIEHRGNVLASLHAEQADFLSKQILSWLAEFVKRVVVVDEIGYHAGLAAVLLAVLEQDLAYLSETLDTDARSCS
jgi:TorA-specific chaperone